MKLKPGILIIITFLAVAGCQLDPAAGDKIEIGIRADLILEMKQSLSPAGPGLDFIFRSAATYNCEGAGFKYQTSTTAGDIYIRLLQLDLPVPCQGGSSPASEKIIMPGQPGAYYVIIDIGDVVQNTGTLIIDHKGYRLQMDAQDGITIPYTTMHRIPQGVIWGYVHNPHQPTTALSSLQTSLSPYAEVSVLDEGNYGHFYTAADHKIAFPVPAEKSSASFFAYKYSGSSQSLSAVIQLARQQLPAGSELKVYAWNGDTF